MQLVINANTIEELMEKVCAIANKFNVDLSENTKTPVTAEVVEAAKTMEVEEKPKRSKKAATTTTITNAVMVEPVEEVKETKTYTKQDVTDACQKVSEVKGLPVARELLATFGAKRISEVKEEDYAKFVEACEGCLA